MNYTQTHRPIKLNLDKSRKQLSEDEAFYLLNHERHSNINNGNGANLGKTTPHQANYQLCEMEEMSGNNYRVGSYRSQITNELYSWIYNTLGVHFISRINSNGICQVVYSGECLKLSSDPEHAIEEFRAYLRVERLCSGRHGKYLVWVDGNNEDIFYLDVEASIETESFTTPFFDTCPDDCAPILLAVPKTCECISGEFIPLSDADKSLTNHLVDVGVKFAFKQTYYDERVSDTSDISQLFYQETKGCFDNGDAFPRCIELTVPLGNPLVDKIDILFSTDNGNTWQLSDTVDKYESYTSIKRYWYQRSISSELDLTDDGCHFLYRFCNDKQCQPVNLSEVTRSHNPLPIKPQGILPVKNLLGFYNFEQGNCPIDKVQIDKFKITVNEPEAGSCSSDIATVKVRAVIHNLFRNTNEFIYRIKGNIWEADDLTDTAYFGGEPHLAGLPFYITFSQNFEGKVRNFKPYIEGTDIYGEMEQYTAFQGLLGAEKVGVLSGYGDQGKIIYPYIGKFYYQEYTFKVKKGTRGFIRLQGHSETSNRDNTSTFVWGTINDIRDYITVGDLPANNPEKNEIYFDTCSGDVELFEAFVLNDNAEKSNSKAYHGYIRDANGNPVEGAKLYAADNFYFGSTDHNGFYHFTLREGSASISIKVNTELNCSDFSTVKTVTVSGAETINTRFDITIDNTTYKDGFVNVIETTVVDCDGNPISGVNVAASGSKSKTTGSLGKAIFRIRNYASRNRSVRLVVMDNRGCFVKNCAGDCSPCMSQADVSSPACFSGNPTVTVSDFELNTFSSPVNVGLKKGGLYEWAIVAEGAYGKISSAYPIGSISIPKIQDTNTDTFSTFHFDATGIHFEDWVKCIKILRSENLNAFQIQWVVDKMERTSDGKIKLTIQSLNDYNASYFFKTNTSYKWLEGDRVEFIKDGDGKVLLTSNYGLLNYQTISPFNSSDGDKEVSEDSFNQLVIMDDAKLDFLKEGAVIELQRSKTCTSKEPTFFSICKSIPVVDGVPVIISGNFSTFDTFLVSRKIGIFPVQKFESKWPSDFWSNGNDNGFSDVGRPYFSDKFENSKRKGRSISFNSVDHFNYFGNLVKTFDAPEQGDIIAMGIKDDSVILAIGENDSLIAQAANDLVRVGGDGIIRALPADAIISDAAPKIKGAYGCQYHHIGSVYFGDGYVTWADVRNGAYIKHDYNIAKDVSEYKAQTFFRKKFQDFEVVNRSLASNNTGKYRFSTGINKANGFIYFTVKKLSDGGINNSKKIFSQSNETIVFDPQSEDFITFSSHTPEGYASIDIYDGEGSSFISYLDGVPYVHTINSTSKFNEFYGVAVDRMVGVSVNKYPEKIKSPISIEIQDALMWFIDNVTLETSNFLSEIPPIRMKKSGDSWKASFLANKNAVGGLYGKKMGQSYVINVLLIRDNTDTLKYGTFDNSKRTKFDELDAITTKFMLVEQSGMTGNV